MNKVLLVGRITKDVEVTETKNTTVGRYTLAVDAGKDQEANFIRCVAFGKSAEFAEKYFCKGLRVAVEGHIQTGKYEDKEGFTHYTTDVVVERQEFADGIKDEQPFGKSGGYNRRR